MANYVSTEKLGHFLDLERERVKREVDAAKEEVEFEPISTQEINNLFD